MTNKKANLFFNAIQTLSKGDRCWQISPQKNCDRNKIKIEQYYQHFQESNALYYNLL